MNAGLTLLTSALIAKLIYDLVSGLPVLTLLMLLNLTGKPQQKTKINTKSEI